MWYSNDILFSRKCNKLMVLCLIYILGIPSKSERIDNKLFLYIICICNKIYYTYIFTSSERHMYNNKSVYKIPNNEILNL